MVSEKLVCNYFPMASLLLGNEEMNSILTHRNQGVPQDESFDVLFSTGLSDGGRMLARWVLPHLTISSERKHLLIFLSGPPISRSVAVKD